MAVEGSVTLSVCFKVLLGVYQPSSLENPGIGTGFCHRTLYSAADNTGSHDSDKTHRMA